MTRLLLEFAGGALAIDVDSPAAERMARRTLHARPGDRGRGVTATYRLSSSPETQRFRLDRLDRLEPSFDGSEPQVAVVLIERASRLLATGCATGLVLHAACLEWNGGAVLLAGPSGSGKSTLATWMHQGGVRCRGDELVFVPSGAATCVAFPRPLGLKASSWPLVAHALAPLRAASESLRLPSIEYVPLPEPAPSLPILSLVFCRYEPARTDARLTPLSTARRAQHILGCLINAANLPDAGLPAVIDLARAVPAALLSQGSLVHAAGELTRFVAPLTPRG